MKGCCATDRGVEVSHESCYAMAEPSRFKVRIACPHLLTNHDMKDSELFLT